MQDQRLRFRRLWLGLGCLLILAVVYLSLTPDPIPEIPVENGDKFGHMLAYATLMFWFGQLYSSRLARIALAIGFVFMGIALEFLQLLVATRTFDYFDMAANSFGTLSACAVVPPKFPNFLVAVEALIVRHIKRR
ncbi:MAG: VanZ family protein [Burkholderiales bacterium]